MLNEAHLKVVDNIFERGKAMMFDLGVFPQTYFVVKNQQDSIGVYPLSPEVEVSRCVSSEIATKLAQIEGAKLIIFLTKRFNRRDINPSG